MELRKIWDFSRNNGHHLCEKKNDKVGFINSNGDWIVEPIYDKVKKFLKNGFSSCV